MISGVIHGVIRPPVRATLSTGGGAPRGFTFRFDDNEARRYDDDGSLRLDEI